MQSEEKPVMATGLERIAAKAREEPKLRFTSLAHHITGERVRKNLNQIPNRSAPGVDGQRVAEAKEDFDVWIEPMLEAVHRQGYQAPPIRRVYIPKPGSSARVRSCFPASLIYTPYMDPSRLQAAHRGQVLHSNIHNLDFNPWPHHSVSNSRTGSTT